VTHTNPNPNPTTVTVDPAALKEILAALDGLTAAIASPQSQVIGRAATAGQLPSIDQIRTILDYTVLSGLLGRPGGLAAFVGATRSKNVITFTTAPLPTGATKVSVQPARGAPEIVQIDRQKKTATLTQIPDDEPIVRVELQTTGGVPVALGPRLLPAP
jgi:hypothetical protein